MIRLQNVTKKYNSSSETISALCNINIVINQGELVSIIGASGSGKSTLLNIIGLLDRLSEGDYFFDERNLNDTSELEASVFRSINIGFVFQSFHLIDYYSAIENVSLPLYYQGVSKKERFERAKNALEKIGLSKRIAHLPSELSGLVIVSFSSFSIGSFISE